MNKFAKQFKLEGAMEPLNGTHSQGHALIQIV